MLKCWQDSPMQRPTFEELVKEFDAMLVSLSDKVSTCICSPWKRWESFMLFFIIMTSGPLEPDLPLFLILS